MGADQPLGGIGDDDLQLLGQVIRQRAAGGDEVLEIGVLAAERVVACAAAARPSRR